MCLEHNSNIPPGPALVNYCLTAFLRTAAASGLAFCTQAIYIGLTNESLFSLVIHKVIHIIHRFVGGSCSHGDKLYIDFLLFIDINMKNCFPNNFRIIPHQHVNDGQVGFELIRFWIVNKWFCFQKLKFYTNP